ncbi:unnamed protein product [Adineta ricciae]|uniref:Uncharacterized protein n=1 Tax=Adineta ricciae TaxID=249248 RepID=A0A814CD59_ADIRI|nr:unnamed protein product [Adineta ricciae]CAF0941685.1 unnamed protein product [Adineta ricciae]
MKFKDYLNSLVSRRKSNPATSKSYHQSISKKNSHESNASADCHYDICGYEDISGVGNDDQHSRTQILLARHAELINSIVETRSSQENTFSPCAQCRIVQQSSPIIPPPPPLPPKLSIEPQTPVTNRNYSSTLATSNPRRECQHHSKQYYQQQQPFSYQIPLTSSQYSTPNPSVNSSSSSSLWTTTASLSKKQRSRIRTNPWIGTPTNNRTSTFIESAHLFNQHVLPDPSSLQPEYGIYDPTYRGSPSGLTHSESFPQTTSSASIHIIKPPSPPSVVPPLSSIPTQTSSIVLHQSDSGHGFSLASSRVINSSSSSSPPSSSSSSPDDTSADGIVTHDKPSNRQKKLKKKTSSISPLLRKKSPRRALKTEQHFYSNTISSDSGSLTRRTKIRQIPGSVVAHHRQQRSAGVMKTNLNRSSLERKHQNPPSQSSSSQSVNDHFSLEFEEILENERSCQQRNERLSPAQSPFILPLDGTLTKTNSRAILKHIEEIENEIRLIKSLDLTHDNEDDDDDDDDDHAEEEYVFSPHAYPEDDNIDLENESHHDTEETEIKDDRQSIYDQVDQWVEKCLTTTTTTTDTITNSTDSPATLLHTECDQLSNSIKDYVVCVCSHDDQQATVLPPPATKRMTTFYLSSIPSRPTKRTSSFVSEPFKLEELLRVTQNFKSIHECPF